MTQQADAERPWAPTAPAGTAPETPEAPTAAAPLLPPEQSLVTPQATPPPTLDLPQGPVVPAEPPRPHPFSRRTGEPQRIWPVWVCATASYLLVALIGVTLGWIYLDAVDRDLFSQASALMGMVPSEPGSLTRVLLALGVTAIALIIAVPAAITGYYAYLGHQWTRWTGLLTLALSGSVGLLRPLAWGAIGLAAVAVVMLWLPSMTRYFLAWAQFRHREVPLAAPLGEVHYGPLPRYR